MTPTAAELAAMKLKAARDTVPEALRPTFDLMLKEYKESAKFHCNWAIAHPKVIADLVSNGGNKWDGTNGHR